MCRRRPRRRRGHVILLTRGTLPHAPTIRPKKTRMLDPSGGQVLKAKSTLNRVLWWV
jgi:hypothetical protein